jgi:murein DD-endopeptidase MepM/ murein hydrolase activator NlpD
VVTAGTVLAPAPAAAGSASPRARDAVRDVDTAWRWPLETVTIARAYQAPAHEYGPGHRGVDLRSAVGHDVLAPRGGIVAFSGRIADRGILTIDHGDGYVTTLEPVDSPLSAGTPVSLGDIVATVSHGGHTAPGALHFGVRRFGEYINPQSLFESIPRAVLLPCCR